MPTPDRRYPNVVQAISASPWAILPDALAAITEIIALRAAGGSLSADEIEQRIDAGPGSRQPYQTSGAVAVIPITGVLIPRANLMTQMSGGTSLQMIGAAIDAAAADPEITAIVLDVDSPGGSTTLTPETAAKIRAASAQKRVVAVASGLCCSGAYWLASQADELVCSPSSILGSIGVLTSHEDWSGHEEQRGVQTTYVHAGRHKVEGHPFEPLAAEARAQLQQLCDDMYGLFVADVARGRRVSAATARGAEFGEGRVLTAKRAVSVGMADRVDTLEATLARVLRAPRKPSGATRAEDLHHSIAVRSVPWDEHDEESRSAASGGRVRLTFTRAGEEPTADHDPELLTQIRDEVAGITTSLKEAQ